MIDKEIKLNEENYNEKQSHKMAAYIQNNCRFARIPIVKYKIIFVVIIIAFFTVGCTNEFKNESTKINYNDFHEIEAAEKIDEGIVYFSGEDIFYESKGKITKIAHDAHSLWREKNEIYYISKNTLYSYNLNTKVKKNIVKKPHNILGKYNGSIITYHGKSIYSINGNKKEKIFKDSYYLNRAVLYKNKVYGIPATNVYEYNLDTLKVKKVTTNKHHMSNITELDDKLYIDTVEYKNDNHTRGNYTFFKVTDSGLDKAFTIRNIYMISGQKNIRNMMVIATQKSAQKVKKNNRLIYVKDKKSKTIDKGYSYEIVGTFDNELLYYKNNYIYGTEHNNLDAFYVYDGNKSYKVFDLDVGFYESISGYDYEDGIIIAINHEDSVDLYQFDGKEIKIVEVPDLYRISSLNVIDKKMYINYYTGEESRITGKIVNVK